MYDVALIGGGIVGVTCALELLAAGRSVALVEAGDFIAVAEHLIAQNLAAPN